MKKLIIALAVLVVVGEAGALAQSRNKNNMGASDSPSRPAVEAPVGHRQPRANDLPSDRNMSDPIDSMSRDDAALDRKIKSICRGC